MAQDILTARLELHCIHFHALTLMHHALLTTLRQHSAKRAIPQILDQILYIT